MRRNWRMYVGLCLVFSLLLGIVPDMGVSAAKKSKTKKISMRVGQKKKLKIKTKKKIKWKSLKKKVASVSKKGVVKAKKKGTAVIRAKYGKKVKRYKVTVKAKKKKKITPKPTSKVKLTSKPTSKVKLTPKPTEKPNLIPKPQETSSSQTAAPTSERPDSTMMPTPTPELPDSTMVPTPTPELQDRSMKELYETSFMMGAAINGSKASTAAIRHEGMAAILKKHYNSTTLSNLMKPSYLLDKTACQQAAVKEGDDATTVGVTFDSCQESLDFCRDNGIKMRGHVLVWHDQTPAWFFKKGYKEENGYASKAVMEKRMENYIKNVLDYCQKNYPGVIYCWDVVNECVDSASPDTSEGWTCRTKFNGSTTHWYQTMGVDYVYKAFEYARKYAAPDVKLIYNDYNVFQVNKRDNICKLLQILKDRGLVDGVGLQPTVLLTYPSQLKGSSSDSFENCLKAYGKLGLDIQVTELSFEIPKTEERTEEKLKLQADRYQEMFELLLEMDDDNGGPCHITSVSVFGICDDYPLYDNHQQCLYLWNKDCTPKEAYYRVHKVGEQYFADKNGITVNEGE